jgi:hypothetical protein
MNTKTIINITKAITAATIAVATPIVAAGIGAASERRRRYRAEIISDTTINCGNKKHFYGKRFVNCTLTNVKVLDKRTFENCAFENCAFENSQPTECAFIECAFEDCTFRSVLFWKCNMTDVSFRNCTIISCNYDCGRMNNVQFVNCETADCACGGSVISDYTFTDCRHHMWRNVTSVVTEGQRYVTVCVPSEREREKMQRSEAVTYESIKRSAKGWDEPFDEPNKKHTCVGGCVFDEDDHMVYDPYDDEDETFNVTAGDVIINGVTEDDIQPMGYADDTAEDEDPFM